MEKCYFIINNEWINKFFDYFEFKKFSEFLKFAGENKIT